MTTIDDAIMAIAREADSLWGAAMRLRAPSGFLLAVSRESAEIEFRSQCLRFFLRRLAAGLPPDEAREAARCYGWVATERWNGQRWGDWTQAMYRAQADDTIDWAWRLVLAAIHRRNELLAAVNMNWEGCPNA